MDAKELRKTVIIKRRPIANYGRETMANNNFHERICTYCQYRHDLYCDNEKAHQAFETRDCPEFVLGKCFSCSVRKSNNNNFVDGICQSFDYEGCINFKL